MADTPDGGSPGGAEQATEKAQQAMEMAQGKAKGAADQARGRLRGQVDQRSTQLGDQVASNAGDVRSVAEQLRGQGKDKPAEVVDQVAERGERLGSYLKQSDAEGILDDVEEFGRQRPWAVALGGLALGLAASRMLKASSRRRYESRMTARSGGPPRAYAGTAATYPPGATTGGSLPTAQAPSGAYVDER
jgi:hypothetical protein